MVLYVASYVSSSSIYSARAPFPMPMRSNVIQPIATIILFWGREENLSLELWPLSLYVQMPRQNILVLGLFSNLLIVLPISSASSLTHERYILTDTEGLTTRPSMISSINSWVFHNYIIYASELFYIL